MQMLPLLGLMALALPIASAHATLVHPHRDLPPVYSAAAPSLSSPQIASLAQQSAVAIYSTKSIGSGVLIQRQGDLYTVLTAAHVLRDRTQTYDLKTADDQVHPLQFDRVTVLSGIDLALVRFRSSRTYRPLKIGSGQGLGAGQVVYVAGFPQSTIALSRSLFNFTEGKVTARSAQPLQDGYGLVYTNLTLPGMSGGAVLNDRAELVAIHGKGDVERTTTATINPQVRIKTGLNLGIPTATFIPLLQRAGVPVNVTPEPPASPTTSAETDLVQATAQLQSGNYGAAIATLDSFLSAQPQRADGYYLRATAHQALGDRAKALADLDRSIELDRNHTAAYLLRGSLHQFNQALDAAIADFDRVTQTQPQYSMAYILKALCQQQQGNLVGALATYDALIKVAPQELLAYRSRAGLKAQTNDFPGAIADYSQILQLDPQNLEAYDNRAHFRRYTGDPTGAIADYGQILRLSPNSTRSYNLRAELYREQGNYAAAIADYQALLRINPRELVAHTGLLNIYQEQQNYPGMVTALTGLIQVLPNVPAYYTLRGDTYLRLGDRPRALADYRQAMAQHQQRGELADRDRLQEKIRQLAP
jgi:tetratricopeptide (TPR) repeat protein